MLTFVARRRAGDVQTKQTTANHPTYLLDFQNQRFFSQIKRETAKQTTLKYITDYETTNQPGRAFHKLFLTTPQLETYKMNVVSISLQCIYSSVRLIITFCFVLKNIILHNDKDKPTDTALKVYDFLFSEERNVFKNCSMLISQETSPVTCCCPVTILKKSAFKMSDFRRWYT